VEKARACARIASDAKASDVVVLEVRALSNVTDYYVIVTGMSQHHLRALGRRLEDQLADAGIKPLHVDGYQSSSWLVLDYGNVIIHAMLENTRQYYNIERLWGDAPQLAWD
jgi:ribosome-associated protein